MSEKSSTYMRVPPPWWAALLLLCAAAPGADLSGQVVGPNGEAVAEATVWLWQDHDVSKATTDASGMFSFNEVAAIPAEIIAHKPGLAVGGATVPVPGIESVAITLVREANLPLCIKDAKFDPIPGAAISRMLINDTISVPVSDLAELGFPWPRSDESGRLVFPGLPEGAHVRLTVSHRDFPDLHVPYLPVGQKEQTLLMYPGVKLRGRVVDGAGAAVSRARVGAWRLGSGDREVSTTLTDPEGFYKLTLPAGEICVMARHPEYASPEPKQITLNNEETVADITMPAPHRISGRVMLPDGKPCVGMAVSYWIGQALYEEVLTQADGSFRLQVPDCEGRIRVIPPPGFMTETLSEVPVTGKLQPDTVLSPIKLRALPLIEGVVLADDGRPKPRALVGSVNLKPPVWAITDETGRFRLQLDQMPGQDRAEFRAEDRDRFLRGEFQVQFWNVKPVTVRMKPFEPDVLPKEVLRGQNDLTALVGRLAPELRCGEWFGGPVTIESLRGKVGVLLFWAGFDRRPEARDALEEIRVLYDLYADAPDVAFVAVHDGGEELDRIREAIKNAGIRFAVGRDGEAFDTFQAYRIQYIPQVVLLDKHGAVRHFSVAGRLPELIKSLRREG